MLLCSLMKLELKCYIQYLQELPPKCRITAETFPALRQKERHWPPLERRWNFKRRQPHWIKSILVQSGE